MCTFCYLFAIYITYYEIGLKNCKEKTVKSRYVEFCLMLNRALFSNKRFKCEFFAGGKNNYKKNLLWKNSCNTIFSIKSTSNKHPERVEQHWKCAKANQAIKNNTVSPFLREWSCSEAGGLADHRTGHTSRPH